MTLLVDVGVVKVGISKRITLSISVVSPFGFWRLIATFTLFVGILTVLNSLLLHRENDRGIVAKRPPLYMATYGKHKMRSNMFSSASARGEYLFVFSVFVCSYSASVRLMNCGICVLCFVDLRCFDLESEQRDGLSPRGVLEASMQNSEFDADSLNDSTPEPENQPSQSRALFHWKNFFKLWKKRSFRRLASFPPLGVLKISRRGNRSGRENPGLSDLYKFKSSLGNFTFSELQTATNKFSPGWLQFVFYILFSLTLVSTLFIVFFSFA